MHFSTLPILEVVGVVFIFFLTSLYPYLKNKRFPEKREILICAGFAVILSGLSLFVLGSRGGLPPAKIYGWPKEIILTRDGDFYFHSFYFLVDIFFYFFLTFLIWNAGRLKLK